MMSDLRKNIFSIKIWTVTTFCLLSLVNMNASNTLAHSLQKDEIKEVKDNPGKKVTGKVLDEFGEPIPSASILVEGRSRGVITDLDGTFVIEVLPTDKLVVSFLGMETQTILVGKQTNIVVKMQPQTAELDEVTVVAYGKQRKASVIGAINTVSMNELKMPVAKLSSGLAGQLAGIVVMQRSGEPGAGADFWIRGINTFGAGNKPLVLVDGVERSMDLVDVEDIASFSILKDATATALYGVRGANGIVLITTKRGTESAPKINARVEYGFTNPVRMPELANTEQWINYYNDITLESSGRLAIQPEEKAKYLNNTDPDLYPNVDWMQTLFKDFSNTTRVNINVTGGSPKIRYYVGGSFYSEGSVFNISDKDRYDASMRYNKFSFRSNIDINVTSSTELSLSLSNQYETKNRPYGSLSDLYAYMIRTSPIATPTIYSDGTLAKPSTGTNPYNSLNNSGYSQDFFNNAQSLISLTQDFSKMVTPGLKANVKFSWDAYNAHTLNRIVTPSTYYATGRDEEGNLDFELPVETDDELGQLCGDLEDMRKRLKNTAEEKLKFDKENKELISNISHDLKTPITAIKGYVEGIMDGVADTPEKMDRYIKTVYNKANDMNVLINELSLYSKIDSNIIPYNFEKININSYFKDCVDEIGADLEQRGMMFSYRNYCAANVMVTADPEQLKRVINNIINNACKYNNKAKGKVGITLTEYDRKVQVAIKDNGIGISKEDLPHIFRRTYRADMSRNSAGGSGLGLSICKKIIEEHGGEIWAESKLRAGTTIFFTLNKVIDQSKEK